MRKRKVLLARFPHGRSDDPDTTDWLVSTVIKVKSDPRISDVLHFRIDDTPITMGRNRTVETAKECGADYLCMIDSDMSPDLPYPGSKPFWDTSFDFLYKLDRPAMVAAPYCGAPPHENVFVFQWSNRQSEHPAETDLKLDQFTREHAAVLKGIQEVAALPTGLILIDMRVFDYLEPPYFFYAYTDKYEQKKAGTEDVVFTRNASLAGCPVFCNWDSWAGHWKRKCVGKPQLIFADNVAEAFRKACLRNIGSRDRLLEVGPEGVDPSQCEEPVCLGF